MPQDGVMSEIHDLAAPLANVEDLLASLDCLQALGVTRPRGSESTSWSLEGLGQRELRPSWRVEQRRQTHRRDIVVAWRLNRQLRSSWAGALPVP